VKVNDWIGLRSQYVVKYIFKCPQPTDMWRNKKHLLSINKSKFFFYRFSYSLIFPSKKKTKQRSTAKFFIFKKSIFIPAMVESQTFCKLAFNGRCIYSSQWGKKMHISVFSFLRRKELNKSLETCWHVVSTRRD
jgi:hypothetical protein